MAETVTWENLRGLAAFRAEKGCAISFYVGLDPTVVPTAGDAQTRVNSLLAEGERSDGAARNDLTHEQKQALNADFERIRAYYDDEFDRDGAHGLAVFASSLDDFWLTVPLGEAVQDAVRIGSQFYLAPLVPLVGRGTGAVVAFVSRERGDLYRLRQGRLEEVADLSEDAPNRHDQGGWSQARYQRRTDNHAADHMRAVAEEVDRVVRQLSGVELVVFCAEQNRSEFEAGLSREARDALAGWAHAEAHAAPADLLEAAQPWLDRARTARVDRAVERWKEETGREGRAAAGWASTLEAVSDGRVELLLYQEGSDRDAWQCPQCGRASATETACPLDGTQMERRETAVDLAVHQTLAHGGTVLPVAHRHDLEPLEGVGALLRF